MAAFADRASARGAVRAAVASGRYRADDLNTIDELGWPAIAIPEKHGGAGAGYPELTVVLEELGARLLPSPLLTTAGLAASVLIALGEDPAAAHLLSRIAEGSATATLAYAGPGSVQPEPPLARDAGDRTTLTGLVVAVPDLAAADAVVVIAQEDPRDDGSLMAYLVDPGSPGVAIEPEISFDLLRPVATLRLTATDATRLDDRSGSACNHGLGLASLALSAEQLGGADAALKCAVGYAKLREQFGRPIGANQSIKHLLANTYMEVEAARALVRATADLADGGGVEFELMVALTAAACSDVYVRSAANSLHVHGGIGFTWEHDAHLHVRRAHVDASLLGDAVHHRDRAARLLLADADVRLGSDPKGFGVADKLREKARRWLASEAPAFADPSDPRISIFAMRDEENERDYVARARRWQKHKWDAGWAGLSIAPEAGGRGRPVVEAVLFDEEEQKHGLPLDAYSVTLGMIAPTLARWGTQTQHDRYLKPLLEGEQLWCQLFSEPEAGSDLAGLRVRARPYGDGWLISGQKVWTSYAQFADYGMLLARTSDAERRHAGISAFVVDMHHPAVTVRPITQATGSRTFNEVFFNDLPVTHADLVGPEGEGWMVAISTLMVERYSLNPSAVPAAELLALARSEEQRCDAHDRQDLARVYAAYRVLVILKDHLLGQVAAGGEPGPEGSITKLLITDAQTCAAGVATRLIGPAGRLDGPWTEFLMGTHGIRIGGGSDEILKNVVAERVLGLPR